MRTYHEQIKEKQFNLYSKLMRPLHFMFIRWLADIDCLFHVIEEIQTLDAYDSIEDWMNYDDEVFFRVNDNEQIGYASLLSSIPDEAAESWNDIEKMFRDSVYDSMSEQDAVEYNSIMKEYADPAVNPLQRLGELTDELVKQHEGLPINSTGTVYLENLADPYYHIFNHFGL
ncbi:MAG: hypothetical protein ACYTEQ_30800 [Planctomycetota bacterium]|jgi:hypothetical protein